MPVTLSDVEPSSVMPQSNIEVACSVRHFIVENVRSARRFLRRCSKDIDIDSLTFYTLDEHTQAADVPAMLAPLEEGLPMMLMSEAGCPAVADPGAMAVAQAHRIGATVMPLVGPSSILLALMGSGFNGQRFAFEGYLPVDKQQRTARLREMQRRISREDQTQIFIETPYRNNRLIAELIAVLPGDLMLCVASDLTGPRQEIRSLPLSKWSKMSYDYNKTPAIFLLYHG